MWVFGEIILVIMCEEGFSRAFLFQCPVHKALTAYCCSCAYAMARMQWRVAEKRSSLTFCFHLSLRAIIVQYTEFCNLQGISAPTA